MIGKRKTVIHYWTGTRYKVLPWEHQQEINYDLRFAVAQRCMDNDLNSMFFVNSEGTLIIFIDDKRFTQR